jgi:hypothetical protein
LPFDDQTLRQIDICQYYDMWVERHFISAYDRQASGDQQRDNAARSLIRASIRNSAGHPRITPESQLREWREEAMAGDGANPLVLYCAGMLEDDPVLETEKLKQAERALMASGDGKVALYLVLLELWNLATRTNEALPVDSVIEALTNAIQDSPLDDAEAWAWAEALDWSTEGTLIRERADRVIVAIQPLTARHPWLAHYIQGISEMAKSFKLPGYGLSSKPLDVFKSTSKPQAIISPRAGSCTRKIRDVPRA